MKDIIEITLDDGSVKEMEIVSIFELEGYSYHYIIYSELDKSHYYIAKYMGDEIVDLSTDLSDDEMKLAKTIYEEVIKYGTRN